MSQAKRIQDHSDDDSVPDIAEQSRGNIRRPGTKDRGHTIRVDLGQKCRSGVLKPIVGGEAVGSRMESERAVEVGQLRESGTVV